MYRQFYVYIQDEICQKKRYNINNFNKKLFADKYKLWNNILGMQQKSNTKKKIQWEFLL